MADLPVWIQPALQTGHLALSAGALYLGIQNARGNAAVSWATVLEDVSGLTPDELRSVVEEFPMIAELVGMAWESAARTAGEDKRTMLAKAVAAAIRSPANEAVEPYPHLVRTIALIETSEVKLLTLLAQPAPNSGRHAYTRLDGAMTEEDLAKLWPGARELLTPMLAALAREGLIRDAAVGTFGYSEPAWRVTQYGLRLLRFLPRDSGWLDSAQVSVVLQSDTELTVLNLGPGTAHTITLSAVSPPGSQGTRYLGGHPPSPFDLAPGDERAIELEPAPIGGSPPYVVTVEWEDSGSHRQEFQVDTRERRMDQT